MSGIKIGDGAVISANACVVKDGFPYYIVGGNPAKLIKQRFDNEIIDSLLVLKWWDLPTPNIKDISKKLCSKPNNYLLFELISLFSAQGT